MKTIRINSLLDGVTPLRERLESELRTGKQVLWLVPGGSNIPLSVRVMSQIPDKLTRHLAILLTDERYGPVGHPDSNTRQLAEAGFDPRGATYLPVLREMYGSLEETVAHYNDIIEDAFKYDQVIIGQFGMGADGHIAGCLPHSPAVKSDQYVVGYPTESFTRITLTPKAIAKISAAYVFAFGSGKRQALETLINTEQSLDDQPAQLIKKLPEAFVYNDQAGGML